MTKAFEKLPAVSGSFACWTCGAGARSDLEMTRVIMVGLGSAGFSKDGEVIWSEDMLDEDLETPPTVEDVEILAQKEPLADWRIWFYAPLYEAEYQRQGNESWVLVRKGEGFA